MKYFTQTIHGDGRNWATLKCGTVDERTSFDGRETEKEKTNEHPWTLYGNGVDERASLDESRGTNNQRLEMIKRIDERAFVNVRRKSSGRTGDESGFGWTSVCGRAEAGMAKRKSRKRQASRVAVVSTGGVLCGNGFVVERMDGRGWNPRGGSAVADSLATRCGKPGNPSVNQSVSQSTLSLWSVSQSCLVALHQFLSPNSFPLPYCLFLARRVAADWFHDDDDDASNSSANLRKPQLWFSLWSSLSLSLLLPLQSARRGVLVPTVLRLAVILGTRLVQGCAICRRGELVLCAWELITSGSMTIGHRRYSSVDTLGCMLVNRADEPPAAADRSISSHVSGFGRDIPPAFKPKSLIRINSGEYFTACFGPRKAKDSELGPARSFLLDADTGVAERTTTNRLQRSRSRSLSTSFLGNLNLGSRRFTGKNEEDSSCNLETQSPKLNYKSATEKNRVVQPGSRRVIEDKQDHSAKPAAWKQALRKFRAEAKRRVHPGRSHEILTNYDAESYEKNFYDSEKGSLCTMVNDYDELGVGVGATVLHSYSLTRLHLHRLEDSSGHHAPANLSRTTSLPAAPANSAPKPRDDGLPIWQRRNISRPLANLRFAKSVWSVVALSDGNPSAARKYVQM